MKIAKLYKKSDFYVRNIQTAIQFSNAERNYFSFIKESVKKSLQSAYKPWIFREKKIGIEYLCEILSQRILNFYILLLTTFTKYDYMIPTTV